jgi:hypothetical protein
MTKDFTTKTPAELAEQRENRRIWAETRRRDAEDAYLVRRNAAQGLYRHPVEDPNVNPWAEVEFSICPPWCHRHGGGAA